MYTIKVDYRTGDSFHTEENSDELGICWESKDLAKQALKDIKEHYDTWEVCGYSVSVDDKYKESKKHPWHYEYKEFNQKDMSGYSLSLEGDDGERHQVSCFWVGYFEHLLGAEIVIDGDDDMKFTIH